MEEPEIRLPTFIISWRKQRNSRKIICFTNYAKVFDGWITTNCGKFLKIWEYQTTFTCLLRNLYAGQEATVRTGHGTTDWFLIGKGVLLFNLYAEYIMWNARLDEAQAGIKIARRNINHLKCRWHHPNGRKWRETKEPLDEGERGEQKQQA